MCGNNSRLSPRAPRWQSNRGTEPVAFRKQAQDLGARGAEGAVPGAVFRKRRRWKSCWLVGEPVLARDQPGPAIGARPREHLLSLEQIAERGDRADGRKRTLPSQQQMLASKIAFVRAKKSLTSASTPTSPAPW